MTEFEQQIYNYYLASSRSNQNKPYTRRVNFDGVDESTKLYLYKLSKFFARHKSINIKSFFDAPFKIYKDSTYYNLQFYTTLKATKIYRLYIQELVRKDVNSPESKEFFKQSAIFVVNYCKEAKIKFNDYMSLKNPQQGNVILQHLKHVNVSVYFMIMYPEFERVYFSVDSKMRDFILSDPINITKFKINYYNSTNETKEYFTKIFNLCAKNG